MNILYLSDTRFTATPYRDASTRYRGYHFAEALTEQQHVADVGVIDIIDVESIERYDVVVAIRPTMSRKLVRIANICTQRGIKLVADFDDLIFSTKFAAESPLAANKQATLEQIEALYKRHEDALGLFNLITTSTQELCWHMQEKQPDARVMLLPNGLSEFWLKYNGRVDKSAAVMHRLFNQDGQVSRDLTYLPGTRSHDHDFATVEHQLANAIKANEHSRLNIVGALEFNEDLFPEGSLTRGSWTDFMELPSLIANSWLTIAPLASTAFNQSKSHIKFIESAAFGTPHICTNIPDVAQHQVDGLGVVTSTEQWADMIARYSDREYYEQCSRSLQDYVRRECMAADSIPDFLSFLESSTQLDTHEDTLSLSQAS